MGFWMRFSYSEVLVEQKQQIASQAVYLAHSGITAHVA